MHLIMYLYESESSGISSDMSIGGAAEQVPTSLARARVRRSLAIFPTVIMCVHSQINSFMHLCFGIFSSNLPNIKIVHENETKSQEPTKRKGINTNRYYIV